MMRQSSSRNHRGKKLRPKHSFQVFLLLAVGVWLVYQLTHSYGKRRAVVVEADDGNGMDGGEPARRRLGRKGFAGFTGAASEDDIAGVRGGSDNVERGAATSGDPLSEAGDREGGDGDGDEENREEADDDDGVDDADDGLAGDEEEDDRDLQSQDGDGEDELVKAVHGETDRASEFGNGDDGAARLHEPSELNSSAVPRVDAAGRVQDGDAVLQVKGNGGASAVDGNAMALGDSALKNASSVDVSLRERGTADVAEKFTG